MEIPTLLYDQAIAEHPEYQQISQVEMLGLISKSFKEIAYFEKIGEADKNRMDIKPEILNNIGAIWIFSGPGTYDEPTKDDKYKSFPWARGMDRARLSHGARIARMIAESKSGQMSSGSFADIVERKRQTKQIIQDNGPEIIYNGTELENSTVSDVLSREGVIIPGGKVHLIGGEIKTTLDQVKTFQLPGKLGPDQELSIVSHAPQLLRIIHMLNKYRPFPTGTKIRLFPVPTPQDGKTEYARMEVSGVLRYVYIDKEATVEPYPYSVSSQTD